MAEPGAENMPERRGPLAGFGEPRGASLAILPAESRFSFRGNAAAARAAGDAFGVRLPETPCRAAARDERAALWLGPDEWLLLAPASEGPDIAASIARALGETPHALVDVGHRDATIGIEGPKAPAVLNAGVPLDLDLAVFPIGMCTRTVFAKAGVVLWRRGAARFRLDVARSFAPYVWRMLEEARREYLI